MNQTAPQRTAAFPRWTFALLALVYLLSASGRVGVMDGSVMLSVSRSMMDGHLDVAPGAPVVVPGSDGKHYSQYGPLTSVAWVPFVALARAVHQLWRSVPQEMLEELFVSFANLIPILAILICLEREWQAHGLSPRRIRLGLLGFGLLTLLWPYAKAPFSDPWMSLGLLAAVIHCRKACDSPRDAFLTGLWLGVAWLARKQAQLFLPLFVGVILLQAGRGQRWRTLGWVLTGFIPMLTLQWGYNWGRFGNPFVERYFNSVESPSLATWADNAGLVLVDFKNGILWYSLFPLAVVACAARRWCRADPVACGLGAAMFLVNFAFLSRQSYWNGGLCFGPRYFLFTTALAGLAWAHLPRPLSPPVKAGLALAGAFSLPLLLAGVMVDPLAATKRVEFVPLPRPAVVWSYAQEVRRELTGNAGEVTPAMVQSAWSHPAFRVPDVWWWHAAVWWGERQGSPAAKPVAAMPGPTPAAQGE